MINKLLTTFNRINNSESPPDFNEKIGNIGLGLLRIGFGTTVIFKKISEDGAPLVFEKNVHSTSRKVAAIAVFILALPLTVVLTGIGFIGMAFSKTHEKIFNSYIQRVLQSRTTPRAGSCDTVIGPPSNLQSIHGEGKLFEDQEIIEKLEVIKRVELESEIYASYTKHGKAIVQQQATRGCTAATAAMLIMDNGGNPDCLALQTRNLGSDEAQLGDIQKAGLKGIKNSANNLSELRNLIIQNDSCIVSVSESLGNHVIIVDAVSQDLSQVRLRDPYHGWEITVTREAFLKEWNGGKAIQIVKN